jgi:hypothetical protein
VGSLALGKLISGLLHRSHPFSSLPYVMQIMQLPTCSNVRIRSTHDAHKIFLGIKQGLLFMVNRRLDADERLALRSGCVYAWEERGARNDCDRLCSYFPNIDHIVRTPHRNHRSGHRTFHRGPSLESFPGSRRASLS